jgi:hypothetical protein
MGDVISILAGGWSAGMIDRARLPGLVIAVNEAALLAPCRLAVTMDRLWTEARFSSVKALRFHGQLDAFHVRASAARNIDAAGEAEWVHVFENDHTSVDMSDDPGRLNGTNSGVCAINLAFQRRPARIVLFGFDMNRSPTGDPYWFKPYEWAPGGATKPGKYQAWAAEFRLIARACRAAGIEVLNASPVSAIDAFEKVKPEKLLR